MTVWGRRTPSRCSCRSTFGKDLSKVRSSFMIASQEKATRWGVPGMRNSRLGRGGLSRPPSPASFQTLFLVQHAKRAGGEGKMVGSTRLTAGMRVRLYRAWILFERGCSTETHGQGRRRWHEAPVPHKMLYERGCRFQSL